VGHLRENLAAARVKLSPKMIATLDSIAAEGAARTDAH
jgi:aryl-alcohol dehydrogenase-like predicted oxidoreductase